MAQITFKRGTEESLAKQTLKDGLLSFTTDDGKIHLDYTDGDGNLQRKTFYSGVLKFGNYVYDGSTDVNVDVFTGSID